jgi:hypothetical protein
VSERFYEIFARLLIVKALLTKSPYRDESDSAFRTYKTVGVANFMLRSELLRGAISFVGLLFFCALAIAGVFPR